MAATVPSIKIRKTFPFKGTVHTWSNRYYFTGGTPSSSANWHTFQDAIVANESTIFKSDVTIIEAIGYEPGSDVPVASKSYSTSGVCAAAGLRTPGECVALVRYATSKRSTKNHPVFVFSYYHNVLRNSTEGSQDLISAAHKTAYESFAANWVSGITAGGVTAKRSTPDGHTVTGYLVEQYITHRDFSPSSSA